MGEAGGRRKHRNLGHQLNRRRSLSRCSMETSKNTPYRIRSQGRPNPFLRSFPKIAFDWRSPEGSRGVVRKILLGLALSGSEPSGWCTYCTCTVLYKYKYCRHGAGPWYFCHMYLVFLQTLMEGKDDIRSKRTLCMLRNRRSLTLNSSSAG